VAEILSHFGFSVDLYCGLAEDAAGATFKVLSEGVFSLNYVGIESTTQKTRIMADAHAVCRIDNEANCDFSMKLFELYNSKLRTYDAIIISDYGKGAIGENLRVDHPLIFADPKYKSLSTYSNSFLLKPNQAEFKSLFGLSIEQASVEQITEKLVKHQISNLLATRSKDSAFLFDSHGKKLEFRIKNEPVHDVTGAGDVLLATIVKEYLDTSSLEHAIPEAIKSATQSVKNHGTGFGWSATGLVNGKRTYSDLSEFSGVRSELLKNRLKLVVTNGCFDVLHEGHLQTLTFAKEQGDFLLVLLNSDESVSKLKGPDRPVNSFESRAKLLLGMSCVDAILAFNSDTPIREISSILPEALVKGGDYQVSDIVGYEQVIAAGGEVITSPSIPGLSSSIVLKKMSNRQNQ
jgi:D-beta-D-heptose 7-phosphate kinase/D-beta-D-heptose 1-phosphate adenosyltransferase